MSILSIPEFPDPRLRTVAKLVTDVDATIAGFVDDCLNNQVNVRTTA